MPMLLAFVMLAVQGITVASPLAKEPEGQASTEVFLFAAEATDSATRKVLSDKLLHRMHEEALPGDVFHLFSCGSGHKPVGTCTIPPGTFGVRKNRGEMKKQVKPFVTWLGAAPSERKSLELNIPEIGKSVASVRKTDYRSEVILIGDPSYNNTLHDGWSMRGRNIPSDSSVTKQARSISPFNRGVVDLPANTSITLLAHREDFGADHVYRHGVERFWRLFFQVNGGAKLLKVTASVEAALDHAERNNPPAPVVAVPGNQGMRLATAESLGDDFFGEPVVIFLGGEHRKPPLNRIVPAVDVEAILSQAMSWQNYTTYALRWTADEEVSSYCDLDWAVVNKATGEEVFFAHPRGTSAQLYRDIRYGQGHSDRRSFGSNFEIVKVANSAPHDFWINCFKGSGRIEAELIQIRSGVRTTQAITFKAAVSDGRRDTAIRDTSKSWLKLELPLGDPGRPSTANAPTLR
ncbi:hypothetical protein [Botrimarina mediterranea]|nr:hypothetical protein [Botrimarina mediterranea]